MTAAVIIILATACILSGASGIFIWLELKRTKAAYVKLWRQHVDLLSGKDR
jgi:hypothetical protein